MNQRDLDRALHALWRHYVDEHLEVVGEEDVLIMERRDMVEMLSWDLDRLRLREHDYARERALAEADIEDSYRHDDGGEP